MEHETPLELFLEIDVLTGCPFPVQKVWAVVVTAAKVRPPGC